MRFRTDGDYLIFGPTCMCMYACICMGESVASRSIGVKTWQARPHSVGTRPRNSATRERRKKWFWFRHSHKANTQWAKVQALPRQWNIYYIEWQNLNEPFKVLSSEDILSLITIWLNRSWRRVSSLSSFRCSYLNFRFHFNIVNTPFIVTEIFICTL